MQVAPHQLARFESFLERIAADTYPEEPSGLHDEITAHVLQRFLERAQPAPGAAVLDVGCGQGVALKRFIERGLAPIGITLNETDVEACRVQGYDVRHMDQSFLDFDDASFDMIWCRHCLEHSIYPYFTLSQFARVLRPGGWLYIEVPAPDTSCQHQTNGNHYSVLGKSMLASLVARSGFSVEDVFDIDFQVPAGPDRYTGFIGRRVAVGG
jgi:SAM-dependent methyltransferase